MNKKLFLPFIGMMMSIGMLSGCQQLHIHRIDVPFEHDEIEHWKTCPDCGDMFLIEEHIINDLTDKCLVCDYVDPIVIVDENGLMTGLTEHGKTKAIIDLPSTVHFMAKNALEDSKVLLLNLTKDFLGYYEGAFDKPNLIVNTEEEEVTWELVDGICYKHDILSEYDARIDDVLYKNIYEAFDSIKNDDTTITILKDDLVLDEPVTIEHIVTLEAYHSHIKLNCDFNISSGGILNIPQSINLTSNVKLKLANSKEEISDHFEDVFSSGTIAFVGTDKQPENVYVEYVETFEQKTGLGHKAVGSKEVVNSVLVLPVTHYAYGTFTFSKDFKSIKGLTFYGQAVSDLYITNVVEGVNASIGDNSFSIYTDIKINIDKIPDTHITLNQTKGIFTSLHICDGIVSIGNGAFNNITTDDIFHEVKVFVNILFSRIKTIEIGDSVQTICNDAFNGQLTVEEIKGGRGLKSIGQNAFYENISLRVVDFSQAYFLEKIERYAFGYCDSLIEVCLPTDGWIVNYVKNIKAPKFNYVYLPSQFDPSFIAYLLVGPNCTDVWHRENLGSIAYTQDMNTGYDGRYDKVSYTNSISLALMMCANGGRIELTDATPENQRKIDFSGILSKNLRIFADPSLENVTLGEADKTLNIGANTTLTVSNVTPLGPIVLQNDGTENEVNATGGFAMRFDGGKEAPKVDVRYSAKNEDLQKAAPTKANLIDSQEYISYGLFNFANTISEEGTVTEQIIKGVSSLGSLASSFVIKEQVEGISSLFDTEMKISEGAFKANNNLLHVVIDGSFAAIPSKAFYECKNLRTVCIQNSLGELRLGLIGQSSFEGCDQLTKFSIVGHEDIHSPFKTIEVYAFKGCDKLEYFDFGESKNHNWVVFIAPITPDRLSDCYGAAKLIKQYANNPLGKWIRID